MLRLLLALSLTAHAQTVTSLRMRKDDPDALFDGVAARAAAVAEPAPLPDAPPTPAPKAVAAPKKSKGGRFLVFLDDSFNLEASASVGARTGEAAVQTRWDITNSLGYIPKILPNTGHGWGMLIVDIAVLEAINAAGMLGGYAFGKATGWDRPANAAERFWRYASEHGPVGYGPIAWKDPNYGDPWVNGFGHPAMFHLAGTYFKKRGYGFGKTFIGGMAANLAWEYVWENQEIPKSGHDILFMNLLGALTAAHEDLGVAWGVDPFRFLDSTTHYTEFYYRPKGKDWRVFMRTEPKGDFNNGAAKEIHQRDRPLFVYDYSLGAADEKRGVTLFVTGVTDLKPRHTGEIHGPGDVLDDMRLGVTLDLLRVAR